MMIKPERQSYSLDNLGATVTPFENYNMYRRDFTFENSRGSKIPASVFVPVRSTNENPSPEEIVINGPCIIYSHSQSGNRVEGLFLLDFCGTNGYGLCVHDFHACGRAPGTYVTLGWKEQEDLAQLAQIVGRDYQATQIALWGRSMGAVTSILYTQKHSNLVSAVVLDSPFSDMNVMIQDVAYEQMRLPSFLVNMAMGFFSSTIRKKVHYDVIQLKPIEACPECTAPALFIIGKKDKLVAPKRVEQMYKLWGGRDKQITYSEGEHASEREPQLLEQAMAFIHHHFRQNAVNKTKSEIQRTDYTLFRNVPDNYLQTVAFSFDQRLRTASNKIIGGQNIYAKKTHPLNFEVIIDGDMPPYNPTPFEADGEDYAADAYEENTLESQIGGDQYNIAGQLDFIKNNIKIQANSMSGSHIGKHFF